jgi:carboxypeptidase T
MTNPTRAARLIAFLAATLAATIALPASAAASQFPPGYEGFHTYAEVAADVAATAAAHPDIVSRFSIGKSYQGRELWAVKISDNVAVDENEPEVLYDGGTHSDEHMGVEMTLKIMHWLVNGYGVDPRITNIVNKREIWIVFLVNPDGAEYDISGARFHHWRKNRQPTPGTTAIGTDLNRNFGYRWGLEGNTSTNPRAIT